MAKKPQSLTVTVRLDETLAPKILGIHAATGWSLNHTLSHVLKLALAHLEKHDAAYLVLIDQIDYAAKKMQIERDADARIRALKKP